MKSSRFRGGNWLSHRNSFRNWFRTLSISFLYLASLSLILPITWNWLWNWLVVSNPQRLHTVTWPTSAGARSLSWFAASPPRQRCLEFGCAVCYLTAFRRAVCLKCTDEAMDEILYCYEMWQCNDQIHAIEVWNHCILNWIQIEMDIFCPCRSDVFVVVLLHIHPPFILSLDYGRIFFPSWNWALKRNSWKLTFKRKWTGI